MTPIRKSPPPKICREVKLSTDKLVRSVKEAAKENEANFPQVSKTKRGIIEDYVYKDTIKKPEHRVKLARMAIPMKTFWRGQRILTVSFLSGHKTVKERIEEHAKKWMDHMGIELKFVRNSRKPADIRIAFDLNDGSWSYVGTDARTIEDDEPTMNYGWLYPDTEDEEYHRTVLHEFGHALGCIHEHQHPSGGIPWDKPKAYAYYAQQGWTREEVNQQVFRKYSGNLCRESIVDKRSIMMYPIPQDITIGNFKVNWNNTLSPKDKVYISKVYPK